MKVMIVEDEPLLRKGLISKINWEALQLTLAAQAGDGQEAMELLNEQDIDIVLTDIRMPVMDGLQLIGNARRLYPRMKFVIISGYGEFEYAREGLKYGVKAYLLKPLDGSKLNEALKEICMELQEERHEQSRRSYFQQMERLMQDKKLQLSDQAFTRLLGDARGSLSDSGAAAGLPREWKGLRRFQTIVAKASYPLGGSRFREGDEELVRFIIQNVLQTMLTDEACSPVVFKHAYYSDEVVVFAGLQEEYRQLGCCLQSSLEKAARWLDETAGLQVALSVGGMKTTISELRASYLDAKELLSNPLLHGNAVVDYAGDAAGKGISVLNEESEAILLHYLEERKVQPFLQHVEALFQSLTAVSYARYSDLHHLYQAILRVLHKHLAKWGGNQAISRLSAEPEIEIRCAHSWNEILQDIERRLKLLMEAVHSEIRCGEDIVMKVKAYIEGHFMENLTLQWVSDRFFIHPNYFSKLFKQQCGESFTDYLTKLRMEHAMKLLRETTIKIAKVTEMVGYEDQTYFCNVFKKHFGMSPSQYRQQNQSIKQ